MPRKPAIESESSKKVKESVSSKGPTKKEAKASTTEKKSKTTSKKNTSLTKNASSSTKTSKTSKKSTTSAAKKTKVSTTKRNNTSTKKPSSSRTKKSINKISVDDITSTTNLTKKIEVLEYYDLPYRYNQTVVKVLAQTPTTLFIYWDISDVDRSNFVEQYGEEFFNYTKPVLVIHNNTMHYSFEIEIDDFANSWYLHVNDSNCEYTVELGRRAKYYNDEKHIEIPNNYLYVTSSNIIDSPNDHILFDRNLKTVYFKDVKTNIISEKDITSISFLRNMGRIYSLYDLKGEFNKENLIDTNCWQLDLKNPSSSNPSSTFK